MTRCKVRILARLTLSIYAKGGVDMTREQKKRLRLQLVKLLDKCDGCEHIGTVNIGIHVCGTCPLGRQIRMIGKKLDGEKQQSKRVKLPQGRGVKRKWTADEDRYLLEHYGWKTADEIAEALGRSRKAVMKRRQMLRQKRLRLK